MLINKNVGFEIQIRFLIWSNMVKFGLGILKFGQKWPDWSKNIIFAPKNVIFMLKT